MNETPAEPAAVEMARVRLPVPVKEVARIMSAMAESAKEEGVEAFCRQEGDDLVFEKHPRKPQ